MFIYSNDILCLLLVIMVAVFLRVCLQLITDCPPAIQDELDLISALVQLEDIGISILPLQGENKHAPPPSSLLACRHLPPVQSLIYS